MQQASQYIEKKKTKKRHAHINSDIKLGIFW